jgi:hypothetical protein
MRRRILFPTKVKPTYTRGNNKGLSENKNKTLHRQRPGITLKVLTQISRERREDERNSGIITLQ